ncbi:MAG: hemG, partial [Cohnella sp.]|nr:hemG [Cohnella sp.]
FEPLLAGIHAGDLYALGLQATFPQFRELERQYGSLIRGMTEKNKAAKAANPADVGSGRSVGSAFLTFRTGLSTVIEALDSRLREYGCEIRLGSRVVALSKVEGGQRSYRVETEAGITGEVDAVVVALPASGIAELLAPYLDVSAMTNIRYVSVANVVLAYEETGFIHPLDGSGFLVPHGEGRLITASTWTSSKWLHTAPERKRLIRCYVGRARDQSGVELTDDEITAGVRRDLRDLMGLDAAPAFVEITRLRRSMPQFPVGHAEAISRFLADLSTTLPGVQAAGQPFGGVGLPDCVAQGREAAERVLGSLGNPGHAAN